MAYSAPAQWAHGDEPCAADMNKYSSSLAAIYAVYGDYPRNYAIPYSLFGDTQEFWIVHSARWLLFKSSGDIMDPTGVEASVSLSAGDGYTFYDLDNVTWLTYGARYKVIGCTVALETDTP